jgi:Na+/proline symporter
MFSILACKTKMNAPRCHTYLEIIYVRYGKVAHIVFLFFALVTNILVGSQLLLGGSAVVTALTGMNVYAAVFLIPTGVCAYVILGGLRATFLCDYSHGLVLMVIIMYFMFNVYTSNETIGSPSKMYDLLQEAAVKRPVAGNQDGSYLTLKSNFALIFGVIQLCSGSGTVFLDQVENCPIFITLCLTNIETRHTGKEPSHRAQQLQSKHTSWAVWHGSPSPSASPQPLV